MLWLVTGCAEDPALEALPCDAEALSVEPAACEPGETIALAGPGCDGLTYLWQAEAGAVAANGAMATYTCPAVPCPGEEVAVYMLATDDDANQDWMFANVEVRCSE